MKKIFFWFFVNIALIMGMNNPVLSNIPFPIGKFFDPFGGFWQNSDYTANSLRKEHKVRAINGDITISYDDNLIPLIKADNEEDLFFGQGYVLATNRLWQMEFASRVSIGMVSEIVGEKALEYDRLRRRKGLMQSAIRMQDNLKNHPHLYKLLEAYCAGVNKFISSLSYDKYPLEFKILNYKPREFTILDILSIELLMVDDMGGHSNAEDLTLDYYSLGKDLFSLFFPLYNDESEPVITVNENLQTCKLRNTTPEKIIVSEEELIPQGSNLELNNLESKKTVGASNNWSIAKNKTHSKSSTIMASDPHLKLTLPSIWYVLHMQCPTIEVFGYTIPGLPGVLVGANKDIAWSMTNGGVCIQGWYKVKFKDQTKSEYLYDGVWLPTKFITEEIKIKGKKPFYDKIAHTHYGPVVYDETFLSKHGMVDLALKWTGHNLDREVETLYMLAKAKNYDDFERAFDHFVAPVLNFSYASKDGDIGMLVVGDFPELWEGQTRFIMPGDSSKYNWNSNINKAHRPKSKNPLRNFVSSANQKATCDRYPYFYHHFSDHKYRNKRINRILLNSNKITIEDTMKLQNDNYNQMAEYFIPIIKKSLNFNELSEVEKRYYELLFEWNLYNEIDSLGASIFKEWENQLELILWVELYPCKKKPCSYRTLALLKDDNLTSKMDFKHYKTSSGVINAAFKLAIIKLEEWRYKHEKEPTWVNYRSLKIEHMLGKMFAAFGLYHVKVGGGKGIVNANEGTHGVSMRFIVEFSDKTNIWLSYPGGQLGNPGSLFYDNMISDWEKGIYLRYNF